MSGNEKLLTFTLEEFKEKFPYKVGDDVLLNSIVKTIKTARWDNVDNEVIYKLETNIRGFSEEYYVHYYDLQPYKETMEETKDNWTKWDLPDGYEFQDKEGNVINTDIIKLVKKQPQYPKTYKECCDVLGINTMANDAQGYKGDLIIRFQELIIARDAYWKIAGEQMGLGKPWEPDWENGNEYKYGLFRLKNIIYKNATCITPKLFIFPTAEMRDIFFENFKKELEECKELL